MPTQRVIVLKLGGSVLRDQDSLRAAVHEVYRWRRDGWAVVAVVSALAGRTDELVRQARTMCADVDDHHVAGLVALGERTSAALLGVHLDRAGVPAVVLDPHAIDFVAVGRPLDGTPRSIETSRVREALAEEGVVVVPGYIAHDHRGRPMVLGRGGSDLTALVLAHQLGRVRCRLIKDVDGLFEYDPASPGERGVPRRYRTATWNDALATDGSIIQHKAVRYARDAALRFELGRLNGGQPTIVGASETSFAHVSASSALRVALLGCGTVGKGVVDLIAGLPNVRLTTVAVRDITRPRAIGEATLTDDPIAAATSPCDIVIDTMGDQTTAEIAIAAALRIGRHVITADKTLMARHGPRLHAIAAAHGGTLRYSATVGGSMPLLETVRSHRRRGGPRVRGIRAVLNGTTNFILDRLAERSSLVDSINEAQALGLTESRPDRDLDGLDAADKLHVIAQEISESRSSPPAIQVEAFDPEAVAAAPGEQLRQIATLSSEDGISHGRVSIERVVAGDPLVRVPGVWNAAVLDFEDGSSQIVRGRGAGRWATAEAIVGDILEIARSSVPAAKRARASG